MGVTGNAPTLGKRLSVGGQKEGRCGETEERKNIARTARSIEKLENDDLR